MPEWFGAGGTGWSGRWQREPDDGIRQDVRSTLRSRAKARGASWISAGVAGGRCGGHPALPCTPIRVGWHGSSVDGALPWQWTGSAMAVAVLGWRKRRSVDGDEALELVEPVLNDDDLGRRGAIVGCGFRLEHQEALAIG